VKVSLATALLGIGLAALAQGDPITTGQPDHGRPERNPAPQAEPGLEAPLVPVDRFSDAAGTRLRRSADKGLPAPNTPFSLDDPRHLM